jgi:hypothetical protein
LARSRAEILAAPDLTAYGATFERCDFGLYFSNGELRGGFFGSGGERPWRS